MLYRRHPLPMAEVVGRTMAEVVVVVVVELFFPEPCQKEADNSLHLLLKTSRAKAIDILIILLDRTYYFLVHPPCPL